MAETFAKQIISSRFKVVNNRRSRETADDRKQPPAPLVEQKTQEANARLALLEALEKFGEPAGVSDNPEATTPYTAIPPLPPFLSFEMVELQASAHQSPRAAKSPSQGSKKFTAKASGRENYQRSQSELKRSSRQKEKASVLRKWFRWVAAIFEAIIYVFSSILLWPWDKFLSLDGPMKGGLLFIALVGLLVLTILPGSVEQPADSQPKQSATPVTTTNQNRRRKGKTNGPTNKKSWKKNQPSATRDPEF